MSQQSQPEVVKRYVLGVLPEEERERFEQRYFSDNSLFEEVELVEDDLIDRYVRGELTKDDNRLFEQALSSSPRLNERVEFAKVLSSKTTPQPAPEVEPVSEPGFWQRLFSPEQQSFRLAFGFAVLLLLIGSVAVVIAWVNLRQQSAGLAARDAELKQRSEATSREIAEKQAAVEQRAGDLQKQAEDLEAQRQSIQQQLETADRPLNLIAYLSLQPGTTRSPEDRSSELTLNKNYSTLNLKLPLIDSDYARYRVVVLTPEQKVVSNPRTLKAKRTASGNFLYLSLPLKGMSPGDYLVSVEGIDDAGKSQPVDKYPFHLNAPSRK